MRFMQSNKVIIRLVKVLPQFILLLILGLSQANAISPEQMTSGIKAAGGDAIKSSGNMIEFNFKGMHMAVIFDKNADRMRLVSPIIELNKLSNDVLLQSLEANYHSVLDARYAVSDGVMWSVFIHPLKDLTSDLFTSAISQVAIAKATFGQEYTSGALVFPGK
ncbi:hypothetical protein [Agaribacter flavus]|uniref:Uncharacterized protein n=1 Tax=Agaribacter flavus TaxID=1902781 RepID=A0ABV7FX38_9ALTE